MFFSSRFIPSFGVHLLVFLFCLAACSENEDSKQVIGETSPPLRTMESQSIDLQGHRGCRGLLPENSIPAMKRALDIGVTSLEMDVVITKDKQVILSHEPFMSHEICLDPDGNPISEEDEKSHNIYQMDYATVEQYDCGTKIHPHFPDQEKMRVSKPLLADVIDMAEAWAKETGRPAPNYNIEVKRKVERDGEFHPEGREFAELLIEVLREKGLAGRAFIQSFDIGILEESRKMAPEFTLVYLVEDHPDFRKSLSLLSFEPEYFSPKFDFVNEDMMAYCKERGMKVVPWTVNEESDMQRLLDLGVSGLISDYPDRLVKVVGARSVEN